MNQSIKVLDSGVAEFLFVLGGELFVFVFGVGFVEDVVFSVFEAVTAKTEAGIPDIGAPVAVRDPVGPVDVRAFV